jgi:hypothetical protein
LPGLLAPAFLFLIYVEPNIPQLYLKNGQLAELRKTPKAQDNDANKFGGARDGVCWG